MYHLSEGCLHIKAKKIGMDRGGLEFDYKHRHRRIIRTIIIFGFDNQIFFRIQFFQPAKQCIPLLESGISATVNA